jgi:hypothetical protein
MARELEEKQDDHNNDDRCPNKRSPGFQIGTDPSFGFGKPTLCDASVMSALRPKADIPCAERDVRFVPIADTVLIPRYLISSGATFTRLRSGPRDKAFSSVRSDDGACANNSTSRVL